MQAWRRFIAADKLYSQEHSSDTTTYLERVHDAVVEAANDHMQKFYQVEAFEELKDGGAFAAMAVQALCDVSPPCSAGSVPRLAVWNLPTVGPKLHLSMKAFQAAVAQDLTEHPDLAAHVVILPNCQRYGAPAATGHAYQAGVQAFKDSVIAALKEIPDVLVLPCSGLYDEDSMYSAVRELRVEFVLVLHSSQGVAGRATELRSIWAKSQLFKRRSLPKLVEVMPRSLFKDWSSKALVFDRGHFSEAQELRQWHSGIGLLMPIIQSLCKGLNLNKDSRIIVKDMHTYDDQLAAAVMALNSSKDKGLPLFGYVGVSWGGIEKSRNRAENVAEAIRDQLIGRAKEDPGALPHFKQSASIPPAPMFNSTQRPQYSEDQYQVTCPRANYELPVRQSVYDKFSGKAFLATNPQALGKQPLSWEDIVSQHNKEFNPTGVPFKAKRASDVTVEALAADNPDPVVLPVPGPDEPQDEAAFIAAKAVVVGSGNAAFNYIVTPDGRLYISGLQDAVLSHAESLFVIKGDAKQGPAAVKLMKDSHNWIPYKLEPTSLVAVTFTSPVQGNFSEAPLPLQELLRLLEHAGHVRVSVHLHTVVRDPTKPGSYSIAQADAEAAAIQVKVEENLSEVGDLSYTKLCNYVDIPLLRSCTHVNIVHRFQFNPSINKMMSGFPAVFPAKPLQLHKGKIGRLF